MSNKCRAQWQNESSREAEVHHFKKLRAAEDFLSRIVDEANEWLDEKKAAIKAGMDPAIALFGHRACGIDANGNPIPEKAASEKKAPKKPQPYKPRIYAPQMMALGARAATMLLDLAPLILATWKRLVNEGIDPRRLALGKGEAKMAALLFEEIGVQYRDLDAGDYDRVKAALDQMEAWIQKAKEEERKRGAADAVPGEVAAAESAQADVSPGLTLECGGLPPLCSPGSCESAGKPAHSKESPSEDSAGEPSKTERRESPYSMNGSSLDWTKL